MTFIIIAVILLLIFGVGLLVGIFGKMVGGFLTAGAAAVVLVLFTGFMSFTTVDARAVGIQTSFGRYTDTLNSGAQFIAPWSDVEEFSTLLQSTDLNDLDGTNNSVYVTFSSPANVNDKDAKAVAGGGNGNISAIIRWGINPSQDSKGAKALWESYKTFPKVSNDLVLSMSQDKLSDVANDFPAGEAAVNQNGIGDETKKRLTAALEKYGIIIDSVSVKRVALDAKTQASLDNIVAAQNDIRKASLNQERAKIDNETAKLREQSGSLTPAANARFCLDIVNAWDFKQNGPLPATFNCGLGSANSQVLVGAK